MHTVVISSGLKDDCSYGVKSRQPMVRFMYITRGLTLTVHRPAQLLSQSLHQI